jgi:hypothetical protein
MNILKFTKQTFKNQLKTRFNLFKSKILNEFKINKGKIFSSLAISFIFMNLNNFHLKNKKVFLIKKSMFNNF